MQRRDFFSACFGSVVGLNSLFTKEKKAAVLNQERQSPRGTDLIVKVLGTAQDGGLPHFGCYCQNCLRARRTPEFSRLISSLAILDLKEKEFILLDATPDIRSQLDIVHHRLSSQKTKFAPDGVLLSHAHIGHYTGLIFFGYEALGTSSQAVFCSSRMQTFLTENGPWSQLVRLENIKIQPLTMDKEYSLTPRITVRVFRVPHRDEYSDTLGFIISGQKNRLLYISDIQNWTVWDRSIVDEAEKVQVALLDGTFFSPDELPGRDISKIGHPLIPDSLKILKAVVRKGRTRVYFTHLNHTNLALDPEGEARKKLKGEGFALAEDGQEFAL